MSIEQANCVRRFLRICNDGWANGWHESNGGNLTYRMDDEDIRVCMPYLHVKNREWTPLDVQADNLAGALFITTGAGKFMRKVNLDMTDNIGIIEINETGDGYRIIWGLENNSKPSSEFSAHFMNHSARMTASDGQDRVMYHAHTPNLIALTDALAPDTRTITHLLWKSMTETIVVCPQGVGVLPFMTPGSREIAEATSKLMETYSSVIWAHHGIFCAGPTFDKTFGVMDTLEKSAGIYCDARAMCGGAEPAEAMTDDQLRAVCGAYGIEPNPEFLD